MTDLGVRLQKVRLALELSEEYVARQIGTEESVVSRMEQGERIVSDEEIAKFSELYCVAADDLRFGCPMSMPSNIFTRKFNALTEADQAEIINLMEFKRVMKEQMAK